MHRSTRIPVFWAFALTALVYGTFWYGHGSFRVQAATSVVQYQPFDEVSLLAPLSLTVTPGNSYTFNVTAEQQALKAINASVTNRVLSIDVNGSFVTQQPIHATVSLPQDALLTASSANSLIAINEGFSLTNFSAYLNGTSVLYLRNLSASNLQIFSTGVSTAFVSGNISSIALTGTGTSNFYVDGTAASVVLDLSGVSQAFLDIPSEDLQISGDVAFPGKVSYTDGTCNLGQASTQTSSHASLNSVFGNQCQRTSNVIIPSITTNFTCGLNVTVLSSSSNGNIQCGSSSSSSNNNNGYSSNSYGSGNVVNQSGQNNQANQNGQGNVVNQNSNSNGNVINQSNGNSVNQANSNNGGSSNAIQSNVQYGSSSGTTSTAVDGHYLCASSLMCQSSQNYSMF